MRLVRPMTHDEEREFKILDQNHSAQSIADGLNDGSLKIRDSTNGYHVEDQSGHKIAKQGHVSQGQSVPGPWHVV